MVSRSSMSAVALGATVAALTSGAPALAAGPVRPARGATRASLVHAFVVQDGSSVGITGTFVARSRPVLGVVCQRTPDAGTVRFVFRSAGRSWRFVLSTRATNRGTGVERALERAC
jgi:hypothetical protein